MTSIARKQAAKARTAKFAVPSLTTLCAGLLLASTGHTIELGTHPDWMIKLDGTFNHAIGMRMKSADHRLYNNPLFDESEGKFRNSGDIVTNRSSLLGEFDVSYQNRYGFRLSGSVWKDFAYDDKVKQNPALAAYGPGYSSGKYSDYTKKYYLEGGELLDAFAFANIDLGDRTLALRAGRMTNTWGIALFQGFHAISYSQNALNIGKQLATPGAHISELFLPREQVYLSVPVTDDLTFAAQWFWDWESNRFPEGGTYLGFADSAFYGPDMMAVPLPVGGGVFVPAALPRLDYFTPKNANGNHGVSLRWQPEWLKGTLGAYYRRMDEMQPWGPYVTAPGGYRISYNEGVDLFGLSLDRGFGAVSFGAEVSYRMDTALNSIANLATSPNPLDDGRYGAMGNTLHVVANALIGLSSTPFYDTGTAVIEVAWGHLDKVTHKEELYKGEGYAGCPAGQNKWDGCATDDVVNISAAFSPQWLQVYPGVDLSMPTSVTWGAYGNAANLSGGFQGSTVSSIALEAKLHNKYNFRLGYTHYRYDPREAVADPITGLDTFQSGNGYYFLNDRQWLSLSFQTTF